MRKINKFITDNLAALLVRLHIGSSDPPFFSYDTNRTPDASSRSSAARTVSSCLVEHSDRSSDADRRARRPAAASSSSCFDRPGHGTSLQAGRQKFLPAFLQRRRILVLQHQLG